MTVGKPPSAMGEAAALRLERRRAEREAREADALRANLQRRKTQMRERSPGGPLPVDASPADPHNES